MILSTTDLRTEYEVLGMVRGSRMRARHLGLDIVASLRKLIGGEISEYADMLTEARDEALDAMVEEGEKLGANAVIGVRFATSTVTAGVAEVIAYGTAVRIRA